jgi:glycerate kinase
MDFDSALGRANVVITGSIDKQTLQGKGPFGVAKYAKSKNLPVIGMAGKVPIKANIDLDQYFDVLLPIADERLIFQ